VAAGGTSLTRVPQIWDLQSQNSSAVLTFEEHCKDVPFLSAEHTEKTDEKQDICVCGNSCWN